VFRPGCLADRRTRPGRPERLVCIADVTEAIATSGGYERPGELLDPHDRLPAARLVQATVVGEDLALADAYATALVVRGERGLAMVEDTPYEAVIVTHDGRMLATPGFPIAALQPSSAGATPSA
jgi:thiamine biosynthesis lipoprotein